MSGFIPEHVTKTFKSIKLLKDIVKSLPSDKAVLDTIDELHKSIIDLEGDIYTLRSENLDLKEKMSALNKERDKDKKREEEKKNFIHHTFANGNTVRKKKDDVSDLYYCPLCFAKEDITIVLQNITNQSTGYIGWKCLNCTNIINECEGQSQKRTYLGSRLERS